MINKDQLNKFITELSVRIEARGHRVNSISFTGHAAEIIITMIVDNKYDFYVIYDDLGQNRWLRILHQEGYAI